MLQARTCRNGWILCAYIHFGATGRDITGRVFDRMTIGDRTSTLRREGGGFIQMRVRANRLPKETVESEILKLNWPGARGIQSVED
jgi:hypothetical protein